MNFARNANNNIFDEIEVGVNNLILVKNDNNKRYIISKYMIIMVKINVEKLLKFIIDNTKINILKFFSKNIY